MLRHAAEILNLKVHKVKEHATGEVKEVPVPIDLEGMQGGREGREGEFMRSDESNRSPRH